MDFDRFKQLALSLPEAVEQPHFELISFRVGGKIFATAPADGRTVNLFVAEEDRQRALAIDAEAFEKLWWGQRVVGLRVALERADPSLLGELLETAWRRKAPKRLARNAKGGAE